MTTDVTVINAGTILLLEPKTDAAREWCKENIGRDNGYQPYWPTVVVEHRFVSDILTGMTDAGLEVS